MQRDISSYPIPPTLKTKLTRAGFRTNADFKNVAVTELASDAGISNEEALTVIRMIAPPENSQATGHSALELLQRDRTRSNITTLNEDIDQMLGGGVALGKLTEFCGVPGIGKTQMGMQLAANVHIPKEFGGAQGHCVYIDTEGSFAAGRAVEIAAALVQHLHSIADSEEKRLCLQNFTAESILEAIWVFRVHDYVQQLAVVNLLSTVLASHPLVKLIVMDSIAFPFRHEVGDQYLRSRLIHTIAQNLNQVAEQHDLAVVIMNQMTTKFTNEDRGTLVPAMGETWGHVCTNRLLLHWQNGQRSCQLFKSPSHQQAEVPYQVTAEGIRAVMKES